MRALTCVALVALAGCVPQAPVRECPTSIPVAPLPEEKAPDRVHYIPHSVNETAALITEALNEAEILSYYWNDQDDALVRTLALPEPDLEKVHRRSFIYLHIKGNVPSSHCSNVEVRWYTERKKFVGDRWVPSNEGADFEPLYWPILAPFLSQTGCPEQHSGR